MKLQLGRIGLVVGLTLLAGVAFLVGQLSTLSSASAQSGGACVVAATHTGKWNGNQTIWREDRPAVVTVTNSSDSYSFDLYGNRTVTVNPSSGATVMGTYIYMSSASGISGEYMITAAVPCQ